MDPAPEGSEARRFARKALLRMSMEAFNRGGLSEEEWIESLARVFPQLVIDAGEQDLRAILAMCRAT